MKKNIKCLFRAILLSLIFTAGQVSAQTPRRLGPASDEEIKKALAVLETDFNSLKAHRSYIVAMGMKASGWCMGIRR